MFLAKFLLEALRNSRPEPSRNIEDFLESPDSEDIARLGVAAG